MERNNRKYSNAMKVTIIVLTWNSSQYIENCLDSIYENIEDIEFEIIVADNGSKDGTLNILERYEKAKPNLKVISLDKNCGTTYPRNLAVKEAKGEFILILDSDTAIEKGALNELVVVLNSDENVGIVAPRLLYPDGSVQRSCKRFPTLTLKILKYLPFHKVNLLGERMESYNRETYSKNSEGIISVDYCISACWLVRKKALDKVGLFDERIFYSPEDVDLCLRMWLNGFKVVYDPRAEIIHHTQRLSKKNFGTALIHLKGLIYYFAKYHYLFSREGIYREIKRN